MDPVARKIIGVLVVLIGIALAIIAIVVNNPAHAHLAMNLLAGGVIADAVGVGVLVF